MNSKPSHKMSSVFNELRLNGHFCDIIIKVGETEFPAHKLILSNCSPYFRALFTRWSEPDRKVFHIPGISANTMQLLLDYAYTGLLSVTEKNVREVMVAADQFNAMDVIQSCCDFLEKTLSPKNCISIWQLTKICFQLTLHSKAYRYIIEYFEEVVAYRELFQLSVEELSTIIEKDDLIVKEEFIVWEAVLKWIRHSPQDRQRHVAALLSKVRLALLGRDYIRANLLTNDLIRSSTDCMPIITSAIKIASTIDTYRLPFPGICNALCRPRLPSAILLALGGWSGGDPTNGIEAYDVRADRWINITNNLESPRAYHGAAFLNGYVYCVGGFDRVEHFNSVRRFDPRTHTWSEVAPMYCRRCYVSVAVLNGCMYAMGGYDGHSRLNTAEYYRPEINQWSHIASMHEQRSDASCTAFNNRVYICGGFNGHECLQTAEYYSPDTNQWTIISPMNSRRSGIGVIAYADRVYAVGGFDGTNRLCTAEAYNIQNNTWENLPSMMTPRSNFGIEVIEDKLFVVGGFNGFTTTYNVECYDATLDQWSEACDMSIFRSALSCCVLSGLPNMTDYSLSRDALPLLHFEEEMESGDSS
ncbi:kelch-like protein 10 [Melanotaenia boesemani]|uniref:kelch-like protein 10 n=1 Tax=Melanotaenia boesemani TaxID=1250792 RepID=UPI001C04569A|nr:kelch-like protein 10 [Melanotaenia boesemani]